MMILLILLILNMIHSNSRYLGKFLINDFGFSSYGSLPCKAVILRKMIQFVRGRKTMKVGKVYRFMKIHPLEPHRQFLYAMSHARILGKGKLPATR